MSRPKRQNVPFCVANVSKGFEQIHDSRSIAEILKTNRKLHNLLLCHGYTYIDARVSDEFETWFGAFPQALKMKVEMSGGNTVQFNYRKILNGHDLHFTIKWRKTMESQLDCKIVAIDRSFILEGVACRRSVNSLGNAVFEDLQKFENLVLKGLPKIKK